MIIGVIGSIGSGKDLVSRYLKKKYDFGIVHMGNIVRELTEKEKLPLTRENLRETQEKYHRKYGDDYVINIAMKKAKKYKNANITGIRTPTQARIPKQKGAKIILIEAKAKIRFQRAKKRRRTGFCKTLAGFKHQESEETKFFDLKKTYSYADFKVNNNGTKKQLFLQIDNIMKKLH
jgi:dephospho-CoA kinase